MYPSLSLCILTAAFQVNV